MRSLFVFLLLVAPCAAEEFKIIVSDQVPPPVKYPAEVYKMTDAQFYAWATEYNKKQEADLEVRRSKMTEPQYITGTETRTSQSYVDSYSGFYGEKSYGWWDYPRGRGAAFSPFSGGAQAGASRQTTTTYPRRWLNPLYTGPGPLVIVNPFCKPEKP